MPTLARLLVRWLINSLSLFAAGYMVPGIVIYDFWSGLAAAALLGIVNAVIRPIIVILTLPINILTLGLFTLVINALMLKLVVWAVGGIQIHGFWAAFWGALVISIVSWVIGLLFDADIKVIRHGGRR